jgi:acyl-CoA reductase-like NAD-dependent aldehyde dehydrogenase
VLELGGNAACIVDEGADLDDGGPAAGVRGVLSVGAELHQRAADLRPRSLYDGAARQAGRAAKALVVGDPRDEATTLGPMISEKEARGSSAGCRGGRGGATLLCGGTREGR